MEGVGEGGWGGGRGRRRKLGGAYAIFQCPTEEGDEKFGAPEEPQLGPVAQRLEAAVLELPSWAPSCEDLGNRVGHCALFNDGSPITGAGGPHKEGYFARGR